MPGFVHRVLHLALGLCAAGAVAQAAAQGGSAPASYNVGATPTGIPFTFLDVKSNSIQGMMVDTMQAVAKAGGFQAHVQQTSFAALIPSLTSSKIDIISAAMLKTAARQQVVDFSDAVYSYGEGLIVKADDASDYRRMEDLAGETVGAQVGTVFIDELNKRGIFKEVRGYDSIPDLMRDLALGRIKAGFADRPILAYQLAQGTQNKVRLVKGYQPVVMGDVCLIVRKGDAQTLAEVNRGIAAIKADGTLDRIIEHWKLN